MQPLAAAFSVLARRWQQLTCSQAVLLALFPAPQPAVCQLAQAQPAGRGRAPAGLHRHAGATAAAHRAARLCADQVNVHSVRPPAAHSGSQLRPPRVSTLRADAGMPSNVAVLPDGAPGVLSRSISGYAIQATPLSHAQPCAACFSVARPQSSALTRPPCASLLPLLCPCSALRDRRFSPIEARELPHLRCTVSLLSCFEAVGGWEDWEIGKHGEGRPLAWAWHAAPPRTEEEPRQQGGGIGGHGDNWLHAIARAVAHPHSSLPYPLARLLLRPSSPQPAWRPICPFSAHHPCHPCNCFLPSVVAPAGLIIEFTDPHSGSRRTATFLPEVAAHEGWDKQQVRLL